jgi:uncharacterized protein
MTAILGVAAAIAGIWALLTAVMFTGQRSFLYFPDTRAPDSASLMTAGLRPLSVRAGDLELTAWYRQPTAATGLTVVLFQGNAGHLGHRLFVVAPLLREGYGVVLAAYPGYGGNPGQPTETSLYEAGAGTLASLATQGVAAGRVVLWGESLGGGVATRLAADQRVAGVILQAPFTSIADRAQELYPIVPARRLTLDRFEILPRITAIGAPILVIHGEEDRIVPVDHGRQIFATAREPKRGVFIPHADHNDLYAYGLVDHVRTFLAELAGR